MEDKRLLQFLLVLGLLMVAVFRVLVKRKGKAGLALSVLLLLPLVVTIYYLTFNTRTEIPHTQAAADTCYWVGDTNPAVWNDATHWSNVSAGAGSLCDGGVVPGADDTVVFDSGNANNVTVDMAVSVVAIANTNYAGTLNTQNNTIDTTGDFQWNSGIFTAGSSAIGVGGNWSTNGGTFTPGTSTVTMNAGDTGNTITSASQHFNNLVFSNAAGGWSFSDAALIDGNFTVVTSETAGNGVNLNNQTVGIGRDVRIDAGKLTAGSAAVTVGGSWTVNGGTFEKGTSTVTMSATLPSLYFDGNNDYVSASSTQWNDIYSKTNFSVSTWLYAPTIPASGARYIFYNVNSTKAIKIVTSTTNNRLEIHLADGSAAYGYLDNFYSLITANKWHHLAFTFDGTGITNADKLKLYLDGSSVAFTDFSGTLPAATPNVGGVGKYIGLTNTSSWLGGVAKFGVYQSTLNAADVLNLYRGQDILPSRIHYLPINEGSGVTANDYGSNPQNVSIVNATWSLTGNTIKSNGQSFNDLVFNGTSGGWTLQDNLTATNLTCTLGNLVDNGKTVTVNGNISIANTVGLLTSTGTWVQGASGNISNPYSSNGFKNLTIAGSGVTTTLSGHTYLTSGVLTMGPGNLDGAGKNIQMYPTVNNFLVVNSLTMAGGQMGTLYINPQATVTQQAFTLPASAAAVVTFAIGTGSTITATGDWNLSTAQAVFSSNTTGVPSSYTDMASYGLTASTLNMGTNDKNGYLKLGSNAGHSVSGITYNGTGTSHILDLGSSALSNSGNTSLTNIAVVPGTSTVTMNAGDTGNTITSAGAHFNNLAFNNAAGGWSFSDQAYIDGSLTVVTSETAGNGVNLNNQTVAVDRDVRMDAGKLTAGSSAITVGGKWTNNGGTFVANTSTVTMSATAPSLDFDGNNDNVNLGNITELNSTANFTISTWVKQDVVPASDIIFYRSVDINNNIQIQTTSSGLIWVFLRTATASYGQLNSYNNYITAGRWHHISVVYDGAGATNADRLKLYIDGVYVAFTSFNATIPATTANLAAANAYIGYTSTAWDGNIQDFRIYNASLSAPNITTLYQTGGYTTGMVHRYLLKEGSGIVATDTGSNVINGSINGATWSLLGKTIKTNGQAFASLTFNGTGGGWVLQDDLTASTLTSTLGTLVDNGKTVTVNGNISIASTSTLTSTGIWIQGGSGYLSNSIGNPFYSFQIGNSVTSTLTGPTYTKTKLTLGTSALLAIGAQEFRIGYNSSISNDFVDQGTGSNITCTGSGALRIYLNADANVTQKALNISAKFYISNGTGYGLRGKITLTGNWASGTVWLISGQDAAIESDAFVLDTSTFNFVVNGDLQLSDQWTGQKRNTILFNSGTHSISGNLTTNTTFAGTQNYLNFGSANISVGGNIDFTQTTITPGTSTVTMTAGDTGNTITSAGAHFNNLAFNNAAGGWSFSDQAYIDGSLTVVTSETAGNGVNLNNQTVGVGRDVRMDAGKLTAGSSAVTVGGSWTVNGGTFEKGTSTVTMSATAPSLDFDGNDDNINFGNITEQNSVANLTITAWVKQDVVPELDYIFRRVVDANNDLRIYTHTSNSAIFIELGNGSNSYAYLSNYNNYITAGRWHHISLVYDGGGATDADKLRLYIDGSYIAFTSISGPIPTTTADLSSANAYASATSSAWDGGIQDFRIYNASLSAPNITTLYQTDAYTTGMVHRYLLGEGSGIVANDTGSNVMNGSISGATWSLTGNTVKSNGQAFNNIIFNGTGGGWRLDDNLTASALTCTAGTLVDNAKTVTVNGNISIAVTAGVLTSTGSWIQGASGNIINQSMDNRFKDLTIAGSGITTTMTNSVSASKVTMGPGILNGGAFTLYLYPSVNNFLTANNLQVGTALASLYLGLQADVTQQLLSLPDNLVTSDIQLLNSYNLTATGNFNFGNNTVWALSGTSGDPTKYTDMASFSLTCGSLVIGRTASSRNGYLKLGSSTGHSIGSISAATGTSGNKIEFGSSTTSVSGDINLAGIVVTPGTSTVTMNAGDTGNTITSDGEHFNNLAFNNAAGGWSFSDQAYIDGSLTVVTSETAGNGVNLNNQTVGVGRDVRIDAGKLTAGSSAITVGGSWTVNGGTFEKGTSTVTMSATASSLDFDGSNDNVNLGNITELNSTANFTISAWMKQDVVPSTDYLFLRNGGASSLIGILPYNTNVLFVYIKNPDNTYGQLSSYSNYITAGRWHHISVVYDGAGATNADRLKLYIDGIYVAFTGFAGTIPSTTPNIPAINATIGHSSNSFDGGIQDFRIYNASLSAPNITTLYQTGTYTTGMVHRYLLREGSGIVATDTGSNVMNGSISGVTWSLTGNTIKSNGQAFNNITFNGTGGGWTLNDALVASGDFTLTAGTFNASTFNVTCVNMTANGSATRVLQYGTGNTWTVSGNWDSSGTNQTETVGTSTVDLTGTGSVISKGTTAGDFYNLKCAHDTKTTTGGASENYVLSLLYVYSGGTLSGINTFILSNFTGDGLVNTGATFTGSGAIRYRPSANITVAGYNFGTWQVQYDGMTNNVTITLSSSVATTSNISTMNYTSGKTATLDTGGFNLSCANLYAGWNTLFGGIIILRGGSHTVTGDLKRNGGTDATNAIDFGTGTISVGGNTDFTGITVTPGTGAQTVTMNTGTTGKTITSVGAHFNNLIFNNATGGWAFQDQAYIDGNLTVTNSEIVGNGVNFNNQAVDINGNVQIDGGKLSTGSSSTNVGGNWTRNAGTVNTTGSTVTFDGGGAQAITSGGQSFNDLVITNASAAGTTFADGAAVAGTFTDITPSSKVIFNDGDTYDFNAINLNGADAATRINLLSSNPGTQWLLNITDAAPSALFVSVQDSDASGGSQIDATTGGLNLGNNLNWLFGVATVVVSPSSATLDQVATQAFSATAYDSGGIVIPGTVFAWSVINGGGTIDGSGLFTAGTTAGSYAGTVKATASGINGLATVTVNELPITPAILGVGGEIELKKTPILPTETAPETTKKKEDITLNDFQFYVALESGNLPLDITDEKNIETIINSNILVEISADLFAKKVNVITISNSGSTYLMNLLTDKNKYQAVIPMPAVKGDFELRILVVYEDGTIKEIKKTITVDPQGYVYTQSSNYFGLGKKQEVRMADAKVTLYKVSGGESSVWDSGGKEPNPAVTNQSGEYAFWVPNGDYYMQIEKAGYKTIKTANFTVNNSLVVKNIEIEPRVKPWIWLIVISVILAAGAYLLIRRRKKLKPIRGNK